MKWKKLCYLSLNLLITCICISGCRNELENKISDHESDTSETVVSYGGTAIIATDQKLDLIRPLDWESFSICDLIYEGLIDFSGGQVTPELAETFEISADGREFTFHLRRDVLWHDQVLFTSDDVRYTVENTPESLTELDTIETPDNHTVIIRLKSSFSSGAALSLPEIWFHTVPRHAFNFECEEQQSVIGTGPFMLKKFIPGQETVLVSNRSYYAGSPFIDNLVFRVILGESERLNAFRNQELDYLLLNTDQLFSAKSDENFAKYFQIFAFRSSLKSLVFNMRNPVLSEIRIRLGLSLAIDTDKILNNILRGEGARITGPFPPDSLYCNQDVKPLLYSEEQAIHLLRNMVFEKPLRLFFHGNSQTESMIASSVAEDWKKISIPCDLCPVDDSTLIKIMENKDFDVILNSLNASLIDPDHISFYYIYDTEETGSYNFSGYCNKEIEELFLAGRKELDKDKRFKIYQKIHLILFSDLPEFPLVMINNYGAFSRRIRGIEYCSGGGLNEWRSRYISDSQKP